MAASSDDARLAAVAHTQYGATQAGSAPTQAGTRTTNYHRIEDPDLHEYEEVEETAYTGAMAAIIKDTQRLMRPNGTKHVSERISRISFAVFLLISLLGMQLYLLVNIKTFLTSPAVRSIRGTYSKYQEIMYHGHVRDSGYGFVLGLGGPDGPYFDPSQFSKISFKGDLCIIPFSQPAYLAIILFVWSLSVIGELKSCLTLFRWIKNVETHEIFDDNTIDHRQADGQEIHVIVGLPMYMKALLGILVVLPRFVCTLLVFWLGCRWLAATLDFSEVLINAIALEFVITLNGLLYEQLMSDRSKRELQTLRFHVKYEKGSAPTLGHLVGAIGWAIGAGVWIYMYMYHLQMVLPGYQWDVRGPCKHWVAERFNFWRI